MVESYHVQKKHESQLPQEEQREILLKQTQFAAWSVRGFDARANLAKLKDLMLFDLHSKLEKDQITDCCLSLYKYALEGKLKSYETLEIE